jgi:hypothetical protein
VTVATLEELFAIAQDAFQQASEAADRIRLRRFTESLKYARTKSARLGARLLAHEPAVEELEDFWGMKAWGSLLSFDMRDSSKLAVDTSPREMYVIMHTYLSTMLKVVENAKGIVVGLRGDGAIVTFGLVEIGEGKPDVTPEQAEQAVSRACDCGDALVQAMKKVVNPVLNRGGIQIRLPGRNTLQIGVGIDVGDIVATKIGLGEAHDFTAYGTAVNHCCKRSFGSNEVVLTKRAKDMFPKKKDGRTKFSKHPTKEDSYILHYPDTYRTVE